MKKIIKYIIVLKLKFIVLIIRDKFLKWILTCFMKWSRTKTDL